MKPLCVDLYCGLGGWSEGFLSEGYDCIGFDTERHDYGAGGYPGQLVLQDVLTLHGSQFRGAACIVASPPCQRYSYMAMPWGEAKREIVWQEWERDSPFGDFHLNDLFDACFQIQREASAAAGRLIPMVVENVKGAQRWVGSARWHFGSYYLWGDVPALMPFTWVGSKNSAGSWFAQAHNTASGVANNPVSIPAAQRALEGRKGPGGDWFANGRQGQDACVEGIKQRGSGAAWFDNTKSGHSNNPVSIPAAQRAGNGVKVGGIELSEVGFNVAAAQRYREGIKQGGSGAAWFDKALDERRKAAGGTKAGGDVSSSALSNHSGKDSDSRKAASAQIAKIPFDLAAHVARCFHPCRMPRLASKVGGRLHFCKARVP
jgi:hypothetical protein